MSSKLVDNYTFAQLKEFSKEKKIPRRTVMKTQQELADLIVRHGYDNTSVKEYMDSKGLTGRVSKKRAVSQKKTGPVKTIDNKVLNPDTGRLIVVGGTKYKELVNSGKIRDPSVEKKSPKPAGRKSKSKSISKK